MSKDKILYSGPWLSIVERDGWYHFSREVGEGTVYILVVDDSRRKPILGRFEICPAHDDETPILTSITGGIPPGRKPHEIAIQEVYEEAGYSVNNGHLIDLGMVSLTKSTDNRGYLFAVDVRHLVRGEAPGDGSFGELESYCDWVSVSGAEWCKCPIMATLLLRYRRHLQEQVPSER